MFTFSNFRVLFCSNTETATRNAILGQCLSSRLSRIYPYENNKKNFIHCVFVELSKCFIFYIMMNSFSLKISYRHKVITRQGWLYRDGGKFDHTNQNNSIICSVLH